MNTKITVGIIVGIGIIVLAFAFSTYEDKINEDLDSNEVTGNNEEVTGNNEEVTGNNEEVTGNNEGKQFSLSLSDNVVATGP